MTESSLPDAALAATIAAPQQAQDGIRAANGKS